MRTDGALFVYIPGIALLKQGIAFPVGRGSDRHG